MFSIVKVGSAFMIGVLLLTLDSGSAAERGDKATYVGGSITAIPEKQKGRIDTSGEVMLVFTWAQERWETTFKGITRMEYGQKVRRQVGYMIGPVPILSNKRKHFLTLHVTDEAGKAQALFELSKGSFERVLAVMEAKSGLKVEMETEEGDKGKHK